MPDNQNIEQYFKDNNIDLKDIRNLKLLLQQNNDLLESGLRSNNSTNFRNLCIFNAQDSLDVKYPMYLHFNIISDTVKIVSVKLSFWLLPFRAYDTTSANGGGATEGAAKNGSLNGLSADTCGPDTDNIIKTSQTGNFLFKLESWTILADHTHSVPAHNHALAFGIYEENNSPTIGFQISSDNGLTYGDILGQFTTDEVNLEIKDYVTQVGSYIIKFTSSARGRLSAQLSCKLDIKAR